MSKHLLLMIGSAFLGAAAAVALLQPDSPSPAGYAVAQEAASPPPSPGARVRLPLESTASHGLQVDDSPAALTPQERASVAVYEQGNRSVVHITTRSVRPDSMFLFNTPTEGSGSGSVLDTEGHILTNHHVIEDAREIRVTLYNGEMHNATLVGQDPPNDMAVLKIDAAPEALHPVVVGDSTKLRVGQNVCAIGNPFGLERTMTVGIISSLNRTLQSTRSRTIKSVIQIDAALNQGNSGGPLLDSQGRLIGMNTAIASRTGENTGVGFAIPSNTIRRVVPQLIENGRVIRPDLGVSRVMVSEGGLSVVSVAPGGPAEQAGLRGFRVVQRQRGPYVYRYLDPDSADLIVAVDGQPVRSVDDLLTIVESHKPGEVAIVSVARDGRRVDVPVPLREEL